MMKKLIFIYCILALTYGWTVGYADQCSCKNYINLFDCAIASTAFGCQVNSSFKCGNVNCKLVSKLDCHIYDKSCYLDLTDTTTPCKSLSSCTDLVGSTDDQCMRQNKNCRKLTETGPNCVDVKCSSFTSSNCPDTCFEDGEQCTDYANCSSLSKWKCNVFNQCHYDGNECVWDQCSNKAKESECLYVFTEGRRTQPCIWNEANQSCSNASGPEVFDLRTCIIHTFGAYHWSSEKQDSGSCIQCYGMLLSVFFAVFLFLV